MRLARQLSQGITSSQRNWNAYPRKEIEVAVRIASAQWETTFNAGDAFGCVNHYEEIAVLHARPFGTFSGRAAILSFWQKAIDEDYADIEYIDPQIEVLYKASAILTARWKMNKASGVIRKELWVMQPDGTAKLREADFEITG